MAERSEEDRELGPTYKSLFIGACGLISVAFGWWFAGFINTFDALSARVSALEVRDAEIKWTFRINGQKINEYEERIRQLEQDHETVRRNRP